MRPNWVVAAASAACSPSRWTAGGGSAVGIKKDPGLLGRGRGGLNSPVDRRKALEILDAGKAAWCTVL